MARTPRRRDRRAWIGPGADRDLRAMARAPASSSGDGSAHRDRRRGPAWRSRSVRAIARRDGMGGSRRVRRPGRRAGPPCEREVRVSPGPTGSARPSRVQTIVRGNGSGRMAQRPGWRPEHVRVAVGGRIVDAPTPDAWPGAPGVLLAARHGPRSHELSTLHRQYSRLVSSCPGSVGPCLTLVPGATTIRGRAPASCPSALGGGARRPDGQFDTRALTPHNVRSRPRTDDRLCPCVAAP